MRDAVLIGIAVFAGLALLSSWIQGILRDHERYFDDGEPGDG